VIADGGIEHGVKGRDPVQDRLGVNIDLERGAHLAFRLDGAVVLADGPVIPSHQGLNLAGGIVDGEQRSLDVRLT